LTLAPVEVIAPVFQVILITFPSFCIPLITLVNTPAEIVGPEVSFMRVIVPVEELLVL
jgi:hypothetical protein